ncbi:DUF2304 domain-containing protein [Candidatus Bathyarchaeota archaeon]|nr:DUF2304 domain-containing protein [Candidatus Bathyarchaeota archaeon]MBS7629217.1 DUF2304 domain-containing protein [Candidatus Bathyarchaeota archaeon]
MPMLEPYGLVAIILGVILLSYTLREYVRGKIGLRSLLAWTIVWVGLILTGAYPQAYFALTSMLGMGAPIQFVTTFSIIILYTIVYHLYKAIIETNRKITIIVQHLALEETGKVKRKT